MMLKLLDTVGENRQELAALLVDSVESGASIGFVPPLPMSEALAYWDELSADLQRGTRLLLVALIENCVAGSVQLALCAKKNGLHRAEVEKLMVHTDHRRSGLGRALIARIERLAIEHHRTLLVLDTRTGDVASSLYRKCGYIEAGQIADYALNSGGGLDATTFFYKRLRKDEGDEA
jgi:acetyltransferase